MTAQTTITASIDAKQSGDLWMVCVSIVDSEGVEVHTHFHGPTNGESANHAVGYCASALHGLGIPATITERAQALRDWWSAERYEVVYSRYGHTERDRHPTLERAWRAADGISEMGDGYVYEIREVDGDRLLYEVEKVMQGWQRIADDVPPVEEMEAAKT